MFLNPFILSGEFAGAEKGFFDFGGVYTATIVATAIACFIMAFAGKTWPVGLAPGMRINAFVAFGVVGGMKYSPAEALAAVLLSGILWPVQALPNWLQPVSWALPTTWTAEACRSIMIRGWGLESESVWMAFLANALFAAIMLAIASRTLKVKS